MGDSVKENRQSYIINHINDQVAGIGLVYKNSDLIVAIC